uniref:Sulfhydryl oxidase n=1 Tax=Tanacetum cinerariifolium TaxID=118510 RepID=A0A6L2JFJ8_TANCI|nr:sulfhydryl oxidase 2-like isoform X2 [Tanacetum cinerariifolium]
MSSLLNLLTSLTFTSLFILSLSGSRSILRVNPLARDVTDLAVDLNVTNFDSVLKDTPASYAIVEFFAHWCPACRNYKPQYEKVARIFNGPNAAHPGIILMTRVDCANKIAHAVYDVEEATSMAFDIIIEHKMIKPDTRATLIKFMQLMVSHHPSLRCRRGSADILVNFDDLYPSNKWLANKHEHENGTGHGALGKFEICGKEVPRGYWMFCRGSKNDTRGFSCGLWVLLHSLSVRVEDGESQLAFTTTCDFIHQFFICEECSQHFYNMCSRVTTPFSSARDFVLWLWTVHNEVNQRLKKTETSLGTGDPKFPKSIWPSKQLCPTCYTKHNQNEESSSIDWDRDEVFKFLGIYYGKTLVSLYKEKDKAHSQIKTSAASEELLQSTNALVVPVGAALAIAVASCLFGALACFWRSQQKNRKPKRSWS